MEGGFYSKDIVDAAFTKWRGRAEVSLVDAFGFMLVWEHYLRGEIGACTIPVGTTPGPDRDVEGNSAKLKGLPPLFRAEFIPQSGGSAEDDGRFKWVREVGVWRKWLLPDDSEREEAWWVEPGHALPLEVGTTSVSKTLFHLRGRGGVARWPYDRDRLILLVSHPSLHERLSLL